MVHGTYQKQNIPVKPVILAGGQHRSPIQGRETWLEVTELRKCLVGLPRSLCAQRKPAVGVQTKRAELQDKLSKLDADRTILDVGFSPEEWSPLRSSCWYSHRFSTVRLFRIWSTHNLLSLLQQPNKTLDSPQQQLSCQLPLGEGLERLISGTDWWRISDGWLREDNPSTKPAPWGAAALQSIDYTRRFGSVESFLAAYQTGHEGSLDASVAIPVTVSTQNRNG